MCIYGYIQLNFIHRLILMIVTYPEFGKFYYRDPVKFFSCYYLYCRQLKRLSHKSSSSYISFVSLGEPGSKALLLVERHVKNSTLFSFLL